MWEKIGLGVKVVKDETKKVLCEARKGCLWGGKKKKKILKRDVYSL